MHPDIVRALAETRRADLHGPARIRRPNTPRQLERYLHRQSVWRRLDLLGTRFAAMLRVGRRQGRLPDPWLPRNSGSAAGHPAGQLLRPQD